MEAPKTNKFPTKIYDHSNMIIESQGLFQDERRCDFLDEYSNSNRKLFNNNTNFHGYTVNIDPANVDFTNNSDLKFLERLQMVPKIKPENIVNEAVDPPFLVHISLLFRFYTRKILKEFFLLLQISKKSLFM